MGDVKNASDKSDVEPVWGQKPRGRDDVCPSGTSGRPRGITGADRPFYGAVAAISLAIGVVNALSAAQDAAWRGGVYDLRTPLFWELSSIITIIAVAPVLFIAVRRMRHARGWPLRGGLAAAGIIAFSSLHIAGMVGLRKAAMLLTGGSYDFHFSVAAVIYEFRKDVITSLLIGGALLLIENRREAQRSRGSVTTARPDQPFTAPHMVWLRDGSTRIRIEPRDILWLSSAGNYVEYSLADDNHHLVRGTLAAEEARLRPFGIVRVHRTRLVNLARVRALRAGANGDFELTLDTGQVVSGSRRYRAAVASIEGLAANAAAIAAAGTPS
jgi:hypothetical protein